MIMQRTELMLRGRVGDVVAGAVGLVEELEAAAGSDDELDAFDGDFVFQVVFAGGREEDAIDRDTSKGDIQSHFALDGAVGVMPHVGVGFGESLDGFLADVSDCVSKFYHNFVCLNLVQK